MKSHIKNNSALKNTLKILHVVKQLKEDNKYFWRCCVEGENERKKQGREGIFGFRDIFAKREMHCESHHLLPDLLSGYREFYFRYLRMNPERFEHLPSLVKDKISKKNTKFRRSISPRKRLVLTIRFLATGISQQSLGFSFRIVKTTVSNTLRET